MNTFNILGDIVQDDADRLFESDVLPAMVIGWLNKQAGDVEVNINSLGGAVMGGLAIANALKGYSKGKVTANVLGIAASMASVIACAADEIKIAKGAFMMIHNPWTVALGDADDLRKEADNLDKIKESIIGFYQSKFAVPPMELAKLMDDETWIADRDCELYGLAASPYTPEEDEQGAAVLRAAAHPTRRSFEHAPEEAKAFFRHEEAPAAQAEEQPATEQPAAEDAPAEDPAPEAPEAPAEEQPAPEAPAEEQPPAAPPPAAEPAQASIDWKARMAGMQAAKDKEIAALKAQIDDMAKMHGEAIAEASAKIETLNVDLRAKQQALEEAQASIKQLDAKRAAAESALADSQAALEASETRYREHVGLALQPPAQALRTAAEIQQDSSLTPAEKSKLLADGHFTK